jgi:hypothetical protein
MKMTTISPEAARLLKIKDLEYCILSWNAMVDFKTSEIYKEALVKYTQQIYEQVVRHQFITDTIKEPQPEGTVTAETLLPELQDGPLTLEDGKEE